MIELPKDILVEDRNLLPFLLLVEPGRIALARDAEFVGMPPEEKAAFLQKKLGLPADAALDWADAIMVFSSSWSDEAANASSSVISCRRNRSVSDWFSVCIPNFVWPICIC